MIHKPLLAEKREAQILLKTHEAAGDGIGFKRLSELSSIPPGTASPTVKFRSLMFLAVAGSSLFGCTKAQIYGLVFLHLSLKLSASKSTETDPQSA